MGLQFIFGGSGYGKSEKIYSDLLIQAKKNPHTNHYVVVPDEFIMDTQKKLCTMSTVGGIMNIDVLGFKRLSYRILEETGKNEIPKLNDYAKSLLLFRVAKKENEFLAAIGENIKKTGYINEIKSVISEFMQYGIDSKKLEKLIEVTEQNRALQSKLKDLLRIYNSFLDHVDENYITNEKELVLVNDALKESEMLKNSVIIFDGFTSFTPVQKQLIQELLQYTKDVLVTILLDDRINPYAAFSEQDLFYLSMKTIYTLEDMAKKTGVEKKEDIWLKGKCSDLVPYLHGHRHQNKPELAFFERNLFRYKKEVYEKETSAIQLIEATSPQDEICYICEQICRTIQEDGLRFFDIAVITGDLNGYAHFIEEYFAKFEIPYFLDSENTMLINPFVEYIKSALEIINKGYTYESVFRFLRSGMVSLKKQSIDKLENYVLSLGIRDISEWINPFYKKSREFGKHFEKELDEINQVRKVLIELLAPFQQRTDTVEEKIHLLYQFLVDSKLEEKLWEQADFFEVEGNQKNEKEYRQIYRLVMDLLNQILELIGMETISWKEFSEILIAGLDEIKVAGIPKSRDVVFISDIKRTRLNEVKVLFFIGVNDGMVPEVGGCGGILSDIDREFIDNEAFELASTPRKKMFEQRLYLYINMTKSTERLYVSYTKVDAEGKTLRPSYFVLVMQNLFPKLTFTHTKRIPKKERLYVKMNGIDFFVSSLREYASMGNKEDKEMRELISLYQYIKEEKTVGYLNRLIEHAFYQYNQKPLSKDIVQALYGKTLENSVSRLEKYAGCAYAHFLQYGIHLTEREDFLLEASDIGTVLHGVLEQFSKELEAMEYTWFDFPEDLGKEMISLALDSFVKNYGENILFDSDRNAYQVIRMKRVLERSVMILQQQVKDGLFKPSDFEVSFSMYHDLESLHIKLSNEEEMRLHGRIDRIDLYEKDKNIYVKVIDYKSGNSKFDISALYYGLQLQLVLYMNVAVDREKERQKEKNVVAAGFFYYQVKDPLIETKGETIPAEAIEQLMRKELRLEGVANSREDCLTALDQTKKTESDVFKLKYNKNGTLASKSAVMEEKSIELLSSFVNQKIKKMGQEILEGTIDVNPYKIGENSACTYCKFQSICKINSRLPGYRHRELEKLKEEEVLQLMEQEMGGDNNGN